MSWVTEELSVIDLGDQRLNIILGQVLRNHINSCRIRRI